MPDRDVVVDQGDVVLVSDLEGRRCSVALQMVGEKSDEYMPVRFVPFCGVAIIAVLVRQTRCGCGRE